MQLRPVVVYLAAGCLVAVAGYDAVEATAEGFAGVADIRLSPRASLQVTDTWRPLKTRSPSPGKWRCEAAMKAVL